VDLKSGRGEQTFLSYEGDWQMGKMEGAGRQKYPSGAVYEGEMKDNVAEGVGKMTFADGGGVYEGEFRDSFPHG